MSAEGQLYNVALFAGVSSPPPRPLALEDPSTNGAEVQAQEKEEAGREEEETAFLIRHPPHADLALEYLSIVRSLKTHTAPSAVKGHLFKLMRPGLGKETDLRERLGRTRVARDGKGKGGFGEYEAVCREMKARMEVCWFSFFLWVFFLGFA
jgi:tRNA-dihydrouridine synthase 1